MKPALLRLCLLAVVVIACFQNCGITGQISQETDGASGFASTGPQPTATPTKTGAPKLYLIGPGTVGSASCTLLSIENFDANGKLNPVTQATPVSLTGLSMGTIYSDQACATALPKTNTTITIPLGSAVTNFYFKDTTMENVALSASGAGLTSNWSINVKSGAPTWVDVIPDVSGMAPSGPPEIWGAKTVFDGARGTVILYGGTLSSGPVSGDVFVPSLMNAGMWEYNGMAWNLICNPCTPGPRVGHGLAYDSNRNRVVLFGGSNGTTNYLNDVWEWDGNTWTNVTSTIKGTAPAPRNAMFMTYDSNQKKTVIFAGQEASGTTSVDVNDLFQYDGTTWTGPFVPNPSPSIRSSLNQGATFDPIHNVTYFYNSDTNSGDLWSWNGTTWKSLCTTCPLTARNTASVSFDVSRGILVIGLGATNNTTKLSDVWEYNYAANTWQGPFTALSPLGPRDGAPAVFDPVSAHIVLFGGNSCGHNCNVADVWQYGY